MPWWAWLYWSLSGLLGLGAILVLYFSLIHDRPGGRRRCPRCWYDMAGTPGLRCPECGRTARRERSLFRTRRRWGRAGLGAVLGILAYTCGAAPRAISNGGAIALVPRPLLLFSVQFFDAQGDALFQSTASPAGVSTPPTGLWDRLLLARACARALTKPQNPNNPISTFNASWLLRGLGTEADAALPIVLRLARSPDPAARRTAVEALGGITADSTRVIGALIAAIRDVDAGVRSRAVSALGDQVVQSKAAKGTLLSFVWAVAGRGDPQVVPSATYHEAIAALASALQGSDRETRLKIVRTLAMVGPPDESLIAPIAASIRDRQNSTGIAGLTAVAQFGAPSVPVLIEFLASPSANLRGCAASWLGQKDHPGAGAVESLRPLTHDRSESVRDSAITALIRIGRASRPALPDLREVRRSDPNSYFRTLALLAAEVIGTDEAIPMVAEALTDRDENVRRNAAEILGRFGPRAAGTVSDLAARSADPSVQVREAAAQSLELIRPATPSSASQR